MHFLTLWVKARDLRITLPMVAGSGLLVGWVASIQQVDLLQLLCLIPCALLAWSLRGRDLVQERSALRGPGPVDAGLMLVVLLIWSGGLILPLSLLSPGQSYLFLLWSGPFLVGVFGMLSRWLPVPSAFAAVGAVAIAVFIGRYMVGPQLVLVHRDSPTWVAIPTAALALVLGLALLVPGRKAG